jgi:mitochondrial chaperone BCS1
MLDRAQKQDFVDDLSLYLSPETRIWYSKRGIPYRRGVLFHGPPGTGKSSLAFAAAGVFNLEIYIVSLSSSAITDDGLASLFWQLPRKCLMLLEDVDAAGITAIRRSEIETATSLHRDDLGSFVMDGLKKAKEENTRARISLSGLLNAIDGVSAQEGRILIMTTNHLEHLDKALIRPGRVDLLMEFKLADLNTAQDLFYGIYSQSDDDEPHAASSILSTNLVTPGDPPLPKEKLREVALQFSKHIPESTFTPAEIQGYLLLHRQSPLDAVAKVEKWVKDAIMKKGVINKGGIENPINTESTEKDIREVGEV